MLALASSGCSNDCNVFCTNQSSFIDECLPQFGETWPDVGTGEWEDSDDFSAACNENIETWISDDIDETCASTEAGSDDEKACVDTVRQGTLRACGEHLNDFRVSCTDYWQSTLDFVPGAFDPVPVGDDDDSAGDDDDDSAQGDDDDSAGDDDDSAGGDDDDDTGGGGRGQRSGCGSGGCHAASALGAVTAAPSSALAAGLILAALVGRRRRLRRSR